MRELHRSPKASSRRLWWRPAVGLGTLVFVGVAGWLTGSLWASVVAAEGSARLLVSPPAVDFGTIRKSGGKVEATFTLRNTGRAPVRIRRIVPT